MGFLQSCLKVCFDNSQSPTSEKFQTSQSTRNLFVEIYVNLKIKRWCTDLIISINRRKSSKQTVSLKFIEFFVINSGWQKCCKTSTNFFLKTRTKYFQEIINYHSQFVEIEKNVRFKLWTHESWVTTCT